MRRTVISISVIFTVIASIMSKTNAGFAFGECPSPQVLTSLDLNRYQGLWYNIQADYGILFQPPFMGCVTGRYTPISGNTINVYNHAYPWPWAFMANWTSVEGKGICYPERGNCRVDFNKEPSVDDPPNYIIIDTDYDNYSVTYLCNSRFWGLIRQEYLYVLSRTPTMTSSLYDQVYKLIDERLPNYG